MDPLLPALHPVSDPYSFAELSPDEMDATWGALRTHALAWHPAADLDDQLRRWEPTGTGDPDTAALVTVPSRAVEAAEVLVRHGFAPLLVIAARPALRPGGRPSSDVRIRPVTADDVDVAVSINVETVRYDSRFGMVNERPSTAARLHEHISARLARDEPGLLLAERDGEPVGLLYYDLPPHSDWIAGRTGASPAAYVGQLGVREAARGGGIGSALVAHAHRRLDEAGVAVTLLHHALPNPRSTPFWYSHGYRPLWTTWQRRPASA
ncbi:GNAT superfamily N-acetyltransferase [Saccharothrix tamanrassetensis]|uniref:GNAT superfamily N-acetyltransferase n=1 Tax=Saccharothrix tamanrassetensis TaxID=1051531 RepID=A0A841CGH1_9PSEU|nr:GNAT family N-acetyltransferase [Saccharothrix tamanrassetensis]MBB5954806.1 GNAT superfamily N-acetyltransferase [Saccharothrix tamanrassetensis]